MRCCLRIISLFLSTLSLRRATTGMWTISTCMAHFYPRSPCGERHQSGYFWREFFRFLSTLSLRRATDDGRDSLIERMISIHALLAESDLKFTRLFYDLFISIHALLAESDVLEEDFPVDSVTISIHALLAESDQAGIADVTQRLISIHALLAESDCWCWEPGTVTARFLSTLSLRRAT